MAAKWYVPLPRPIEAVQWNGDLSDLPTKWLELDMFTLNDDTTVTVRTLDGLADAEVGDYIIRGTVNEFYPVKRLIFEGKYREQES
jgi:hypothetical protein